MPFVVPSLLVGFASGFAALVGGAAFGAAFISAFVTSIVVGGVATALAKKPKEPIQSDGRTVTVRQPISPWEVALGRCRKGGILTFRYISSDRRFWHMVITVACHRVEAIDEVWLNDERLALNAIGHAQGRFAKTVVQPDIHIATVPGTPFQVTVPTTVTAVQAVQMDLYGTGEQWPLALVSGTPQALSEYSRAGSVFTFHAGAQGKEVLIQTISANENSYVRVLKSLGDEASSVQPFPDLVAESGGRWTQDHKQFGHAKIYVRLEANTDLFPLGVPNFSVVLRGANDIYDPRTDTEGYTANAALAINWYLTNEEFGPGFDYDQEVDEDDLITAANDADDAVTLAAGGSEPRYRVNGAFTTSEQPKGVLERLLAACAGTLVDLGDKWRINMGVYHAPTVTLSESDLAGATVINPYLPAREDANGVKGIFTNPNANWQPDDFPAIEGAAYLAADEGKRKWKDLDLTAFVTSGSQAQRLAKIDLLKLRQPLSEEATFKISAWSVVPGRTVARTDTQLGWSAKPFEVLDSELAIVGEDAPVLAVKHVLRETAAAIYDWSTSDEGVEDLAPNTELPDPGDIPAPGAPIVAEQLVETRDGRGVAVRVVVTWEPSAYPFSVLYQAETRVSGQTEWQIEPLRAGAMIEFFDVAPQRYDFRVKAVASGLGLSSEYSTVSNVEIVGLGAPPSAPTGVSLQIAGGTAIITLDQHSALDVRRGGRILVRHTEATSSQSWEESSSIGNQESWPGDAVVIFLPLKPGSYLIKARDAIGGESATFATAVTKQASVLTFAQLATPLQEDTTFPGTHSDTAVVSSTLRLAESGGVVAPDGTYTFSAGFDFTTVKRARITGQLEAVVFNTLDLIDSRVDDIDDWLDFDGTTGIGSGADCWLEARETDDDPAGTPTWSAWKRLDASEYQCRAMQFRLQMVSHDATINLQVDVLRVKADEVT